MFSTRSLKPERIDTGDYTPEEYDRFLKDIRLINRLTGDRRALRRSLLREIETEDLQRFSVLDVGAGSGELLRASARFARRQDRQASFCGLELSARSAAAIIEETRAFQEITAVRGNALNLPFADGSFDFAICSLFTHHLVDGDVIRALTEMGRVATRAVFVIDLHRHPAAYFFYKIFCATFRISPLVRQDGSLSILKSFRPRELEALGKQAHFASVSVKRSFPFRMIFRGA